MVCHQGLRRKGSSRLVRNRVAMTAAASAGKMPHTTMPALAPHWLVSAPMSGAPMGVPPTKTSMYSPITRPRSSASTASCTNAFAVACTTRLVKPMAPSRMRNTAMPGAIAAPTSSSPNAAAHSVMTRSLGRSLAPATSAPVADPIARTILNRPYVLASPWNTDFAIAVSTIGKLRPNVPSIPTRKIVHATSGRRRK
jgi:hypothetical protein